VTNANQPFEPDDAAAVLEALSDSLQYMAGEGCRGFDCGPEHLKTIEGWGQTRKDIHETLADIRSDLEGCRRCNLSSDRNHIVFGEGHPDARLVFIGEGPGYEEDKQGQPFVGPAGQLLTKIIAAMGLTREQVYIGNIVKCRPPGNRNPAPEEISACLPFLERQLAAIQPEFICALGKFAAQTLLQTDLSISRLRGRLHSHGAVRVLPTYHPAYLLRNPARKRDVWEDIKTLMRAMEL